MQRHVGNYEFMRLLPQVKPLLGVQLDYGLPGRRIKFRVAVAHNILLPAGHEGGAMIASGSG